jgi:FkbM family methyltransferase
MASALLRALRPLISRSPALASTFRRYRDAKALSRPAVQTPLGFKFAGHEQMEAGLFEPDEVRTLQKLLPQHEVFLNVGANIGYYCCLALHHGLQVLAFEPVPGNLQYLYRNLRSNGWEQSAEVFPMALGDHHGLVDIFGGGTMASLVEGWAGIPSDYRETVPLTTIDGSVAHRLEGRRCLVLIDVEGAELGVLQGARRLLGFDPSPVWVVEIVIDEHQPQGIKINPKLLQTFDEFERHGYLAWLIGKDVRPVEYDEVRAVAKTGVNTFSGHNFVFAKCDPWSVA